MSVWSEIHIVYICVFKKIPTTGLPAQKMGLQQRRPIILIKSRKLKEVFGIFSAACPLCRRLFKIIAIMEKVNELLKFP